MKRIDFNSPQTITSLLIHGLNNTGKTHLLGSILSHERAKGKAVYVGVEGEPYATLMGADLTGVELVEISSVDEVPALVKEIGQVHCIVLDSVQRLAELAATKITGGTRGIGDKEDHGKEWNKLKFETFKVIELLKKHSSLFVSVCPTGLHEHAITKATRAVPHVPGVGEVLVGRFNFVGYLEAMPVSPTVTKRVLSFQTRMDAVTRSNARKPIVKAIEVVNGLECWAPIKSILDSALQGI